MYLLEFSPRMSYTSVTEETTLISLFRQKIHRQKKEEKEKKEGTKGGREGTGKGGREREREEKNRVLLIHRNLNDYGLEKTADSANVL